MGGCGSRWNGGRPRSSASEPPTRWDHPCGKEGEYRREACPTRGQDRRDACPTGGQDRRDACPTGEQEPCRIGLPPRPFSTWSTASCGGRLGSQSARAVWRRVVSECHEGGQTTSQELARVMNHSSLSSTGGCRCRSPATRRATPESRNGRRGAGRARPSRSAGPQRARVAVARAALPGVSGFPDRPGSVMNAISRMSPPHVGHARGNSSPTRAISLTQAIREVSWLRGLPAETPSAEAPSPRASSGGRG